MAHKTGNRIVESSTSTGTGPVALTALTTYKRFSSVMTVGDTCWYLIEAVDVNGFLTGPWEAGRGSYSATNTLMRNTVMDSSNTGAPVNFGAGTKRVSMAALAPTVDTAAEWRAALGITSTVDDQETAAIAALTAGAAQWEAYATSPNLF